MAINGKVRIDAFPESAFRYRDRCPIVCIDVICSSTTVVTAVAQGRSVLPVGSPLEAVRLANLVPSALLTTEAPPGEVPLAFDTTLDVAALAARTDRRPLVLFDDAGARLIANCHPGTAAVYVACFRNLTATVEFLATRHDEVVVLAAGDRGDFRCEDKMAAARIARGLVKKGFSPEGQGTADIIERWGEVETAIIKWGRSADDLRRLGRDHVLEFILAHVDDLDVVCRYHDGKAAAVTPEAPRGAVRSSVVEREVAL